MVPFAVRHRPHVGIAALRTVIFHLNLQKFLFIMPKTYSHHAALKEQRLALKVKSQKFIPGNVKLIVLGSGSKGMPSSLYLFSDQSSYLFNCGEGTQRLANEHKRKLSKLDNIFVTYPSWNNIGGLPGLSLTVQDVGLPRITLHGPDGLDEIFSATKRFVVLNHLAIEKANCLPSQHFEDNVLTVKYVPLIADSQSCGELFQVLPPKQTESPPLVEDDTDYYWHERKSKIENSIANQSEDDNTLKRKDTTQTSDQEPKKKKVLTPGSTSMAFICQLKPRPGALNFTKCVEYNVPVGPLLGRLKAGKDVTLADGTIVRADDVREPNDPGPIFIVVECPTSSFINALVNESIFERYQKNAKKDEEAFLVVHFSPPEVMKDSRYESWMNTFLPSTKHLIMNESNECSGSIAIHQIQHQLNLFDGNVFPLLKDSTVSEEKNINSAFHEDTSMKNLTIVENSESRKKLDSRQCSLNGNNASETHSNDANQSSRKEDRQSESISVIHGKTLLNVDLRPSKTIQSDHCLVLKPNEYIEEVLKVDGFSARLNDFHSQLKSLSPDSTDYPKIIFFGTGSSIPNKIRNTSGILLQSNAETSVILDCGEGTYGQIVRFFGKQESNRILSSIRAIYVSHLHADHHIGLIGLLQARRKAMVAEDFSPVYLLAPHQIMAWLNVYHKDFEPILDDFKIISNTAFSDNDGCQTSNEEINLLLSTLDLSQIQITRVKHCPNAFGISLTHSAGWKITYSGDTMPCEELVRIGMNSDLLIHEATMEDDLLTEALIKLHSTTSQAIEVGRKMNAKFTLLTHFSQRYAKLPNLSHNYDNVGIAFDNMQVRLSDLKKLPLMIPALQMMFAEHCEEMKLKALKRQRRQERLECQT